MTGRVTVPKANQKQEFKPGYDFSHDMEWREGMVLTLLRVPGDEFQVKVSVRVRDGRITEGERAGEDEVDETWEWEGVCAKGEEEVIVHPVIVPRGRVDVKWWCKWGGSEDWVQVADERLFEEG